MRKLCCAFFVTLLICSMVQASNGPKMIIPEKMFDFGELWEGQIIEQTFKVQNKGDQPLEIRRINPG